MDMNTAEKYCPNRCERKEVVVIGMHLFNSHIKLIIQYFSR
jgi:hypothetical protein